METIVAAVLSVLFVAPLLFVAGDILEAWRVRKRFTIIEVIVVLCCLTVAIGIPVFIYGVLL